MITLTQRKLLLIVLIFVTLFSLIAYSPITSSAAPLQQNFAASVEPLGGLVQRLPSGQSTWAAVSAVTQFAKGDQLRTADGGSARITTPTGITIEVYPNTWIVAEDFNLSQGDDNALTFVISQLSGISYVNVERKLKSADNVSFITPSGVAKVQGTKFYVFVSRTGNSAIVGEENTVTVSDIKKNTVKNDADNLTYLLVNKDNGALVCTNVSLSDGKITVLTTLATDVDRRLLGNVLTEMLTSNVNPKILQFLSQLLGLPETTTPQDFVAALAKMDKAPDIAAFMDDFRTFLRAYFTFVSTSPLTKDIPPAPASCGNNLCETNPQGESLLNCPKDCLPNGNVLRSCIKLISNGKPETGGSGGFTPKPTATGTLTSTPQIATPKPSGIGG